MNHPNIADLLLPAVTALRTLWYGASRFRDNVSPKSGNGRVCFVFEELGRVMDVREGTG